MNMKKLLFIFLSFMFFCLMVKAQQKECDKYRQELQSKTNSKVTSSYRNDGSSHSTNKCGTDFSTKGMNSKQITRETQNLSKDGSFCQHEKIEGNKQTNERYQNGSYVGSLSSSVQKGVTGDHIHCQKPKDQKKK
jgi:hypothetical protein